MKRRLSVITGLLLVLLTLFEAIAVSTPVSAQAANKDVTDDVKYDERYFNNTAEAASGVVYYALNNLKVGKSKTLKFSKASARRAILKHMNLISFSSSTSEALFGKKTTNAKPEEEYDWDNRTPMIWTTKVVKTGKNTYKASTVLLLSQYDGYSSNYKKCGTATIWFKETAGEAPYYVGEFVFTKMTIKRTKQTKYSL